MNNPWPALVFGGLLLLTGGMMLFAQRKAAAAAEQEPQEETRQFLRRRSRRRSQVAGMILLIGVMIPVGDSLINWIRAPATFGVYWTIVLGLAFWTGLLAVGDMAATRAQMARELNRLHRSQLELHSLAKRVRQSENDEPRHV